LDIESGELLSNPVTLSESIYSISISSDEKMLASNEGSKVKIHNLFDGSIIPIDIEVIGDSNVAISPNGTSIAVVSITETDQNASDTYYVEIWPISEEGSPNRYETKEVSTPRQVEFSSDGEMLAIGFHNGQVEFRNISDGALVTELDAASSWYVGDLEFLPNVDILATLSFGDRITLFDLSNGAPIQVFREAISMGISFDGSLIAGGTRGGSLKIWEISSGYELLKIDNQPELIWSVVISPDGKLLVTGDEIGAIAVWSADDGTLLKKWRAHTSIVRDLLFTSDGAMLISASEDGTIRFWGVKP
jgi:WD40 repeat protein